MATINHKSIYIRVLTFTVLLILSSCSKFLEIAPPKTELIDKTIFENATTANSAIIGIYSKIVNERSLPYYISLYAGLSADELYNFSTIGGIAQFYKNSLADQNTYIYNDLWASPYSYIYQANAVLEGLDNSTNLSDKLKKQLKGEALFLRAFWNFYLVNLFGEIPLPTSTDYIQTSRLKRESVETVYSKIVKDLMDSALLLNEEYVGVDGITSVEDRVRPNRSCAYSLLARVYLYQKNYVRAEEMATKVIDRATTYEIEGDINNVFLKNSKETIWALQPNPASGYNTPEGKNYILTRRPSTQTTSTCSTISETLLNSFDSTDFRKINWIGEFNGNKFNFKYKINKENSLLEYSIVIRLAEIYLIRSEARAYESKTADALSDINKIRARANLAPLVNLNADALTEAITHERQLELFCEWGHRWLDLKRTNTITKIMTIEAAKKGTTWKTTKSLFPIPQADRLNNPNLTQNEGY